jgi:PhoH-like ATPase
VKHFVLDTNVLIHDPRAMLQFADNDVVIPIFVLEEIDQFKKEASERGRNAREVARVLDRLRAAGARLSSEGAPLESGGRLRVLSAARSVPTTLRESQIADHLILMVALDVRDANENEPTIFVTKDVNLRIRADALGLTAMDFEAERIDIEELYSGISELPVSGGDVDAFYTNGTLELDQATLSPNQYILLRDRDSPSHSALGRYDGATRKLVPLRKIREGVWGIRPRNKEQHCALDLLLSDDIKLITLVGKAGTGKTMLALAAGLQKVVEESVYSKMLVSRPIFPLGRDVGYLPGDLEEKLNPWMQPIYDNVEFLMGLSKAERKNGRSYQELIHMGFIEIEPLTYIRGRSIPNQFIIVDEAQNLTPHEVKTIITRVGEATKVVLTGDPYQIDNPYVDATSNGLTTVVEKFKGETISGHVTLSKGERSQLAELASNVL